MALVNRVYGCLAVVLLSSSACTDAENRIALSRTAPADVPVPPADGPQLGATAHATPVRQQPARDATIIGYLHAGARVARAETPYSNDDCAEGWYPIHPRGFVCLDEGATLDLRHPTLTTMAIQPNLDDPLPYTYARTTKDTPVFAVDEAQERRVRQARQMTSKSGVAIVGSWEAAAEDGTLRRLGMMTNGRFLDAEALREVTLSSFRGVILKPPQRLPIGFIVKRDISAYKLSGVRIERAKELPYHSVVPLTGEQRTVRSQKFWETEEGLWVRHRDMTTARQRTKMPEFVKENTRWMDISIIAGTLVAYEGTQPRYATLVSVGEHRLAEYVDAKVTQRGEFPVIAKHITALNADVRGFANRVEIHDSPWTLELSSGQLVHGAFWHDRFGIEHGPGNVQLSPHDASWLWRWAGPKVPSGWHAVILSEAEQAENPTIVNIRR